MLHSHKPTLISQQTQTDHSFIFLQEKLQRKDFEILHLKNKLQIYKQELDSLKRSHSPLSKNSPSFSRLSQSSETSSKPRLAPLSSQGPDKHPTDNTKFIRNAPLDTVIIEEYTKPSPKNSSLRIKRENLQSDNRSFLRTSKKRRVKKTVEGFSLASNPKKNSKSTQGLNNSLISEMVYNENQNKQSWNDLLHQFRRHPGLMKYALDKNDRYYCYFDLGESKPRQSSNNQRKNQGYYEVKKRPKSVKAGKMKSFNIDWSASEIDELVVKGVFHFQSGESCFTGVQIEELLGVKDCWDLDDVYNKGVNTLEKLKSELLLPKSYSIPIAKSVESVERLLETCLKLLKVRALLVKILKVIHSREDLMLQLIDGEAQKAESLYLSLHKHNQEIVQMIAFLKHCKFPISKFTYLGEDYQKKIKQDNENIISLYPELENCEVLGGYN